jgi:hypothetical protein
VEVNGKNLTITRGDSESLTIRCIDKATKEVIPFQTGDTLYFTVKTSTGTSVKSLQKVITLFSNGIAIIDILPEDTQNLKGGTYVYDIQWNKQSGQVKSIVKTSKFIIDEDVTS